ncbi:MAG: ComF family protein [Rhodospirillales bacterium]|nr:ComF family protein [Rhodospirillales bacterium]
MPGELKQGGPALPDGGAARGGSIPKRLLDSAIGVLLPHRCMACGDIVEAAGLLCESCWPGIEFIGPPWCEACGLPFEYDVGEGVLCGVCSRTSPPFVRARGAVLYNATSRRLALGFKHGDRTENAAAFARWMMRAGAELIAGCDLIVPVPLHWTRLFTRRYNQAALLAKAIAKETEASFAPEVLVRRRRTPSQGYLGRAARRRNVAGSFAVPARAESAISGKRILLIDDVMTTGATVAACSRACRRGGAAAVDVLTFARVAAPAL